MHLFLAGTPARPPLLCKLLFPGFVTHWCLRFNQSEELQSILSSLYTQDGVLIWIPQGTQNKTTEIEAETIMAGIKIRMEVDLTSSFNHLSLTALLSDLLRSFQKKILWISVFIACPLQSQVRLWVRLVSNVVVNKTRRTQAVSQRLFLWFCEGVLEWD